MLCLVTDLLHGTSFTRAVFLHFFLINHRLVPGDFSVSTRSRSCSLISYSTTTCNWRMDPGNVHRTDTRRSTSCRIPERRLCSESEGCNDDCGDCRVLTIISDC